MSGGAHAQEPRGGRVEDASAPHAAATTSAFERDPRSPVRWPSRSERSSSRSRSTRRTLPHDFDEGWFMLDARLITRRAPSCRLPAP
jgi:hypothetical protein